MKNVVIAVLATVSAGSLYYGYTKASQVEGLTVCELEREELKDQAEQYKTQATELQKMYDQAAVEMQVQRTICEEQLKALKK
jgi:Tfp pilus assembly protein PilO